VDEAAVVTDAEVMATDAETLPPLPEYSSAASGIPVRESTPLLAALTVVKFSLFVYLYMC